MKRFALLSMACALISASGCGQMPTPLPQRFDPETQQKVDESWNQAFAPCDRLAHQDLLDVMVGTQAYQLGIDSFMFRAEKRIAIGKVIMEAWFDRSRPDDDRFMVSVYGANGKPIRVERYSREEIETTHRDLFPRPGENGRQAPGIHQRWEKIAAFFPRVSAEKVEEAPKPKPKE